jgi:hypothetical protein
MHALHGMAGSLFVKVYLDQGRWVDDDVQELLREMWLRNGLQKKNYMRVDQILNFDLAFEKI